jgi:hypothetical protein
MEVPKSLFRPDSHLTVEAVALYVDALKLDRLQGLPQAMLEHVEKCETCKGDVTNLFSLLVGEDYSTVTQHPFLNKAEQKPRSPLPAILRIAAVIVAVIGIGAMVAALYLRDDEAVTVTPAVAGHAQGDTIASEGPKEAGNKKKQESQKAFAARFVESPELEDLMRSSLRSAETEVLSPANGTSTRDGLFFRWTTSAAPPFDLTILDNRGFSVKSIALEISAFRMKDSLQAGLYYWKIIAEGNLLHVGKFFVRQEQ